MNGRDELLASIANTISDYRAGDLPEPTPDHVDRWIRQFGEDVQLPMLRELDHVFQRTYFARARVDQFFEGLIDNRRLAGEDPREFWRSVHLFDIQQDGNSQAEIRQLFSEALARKHDVAAGTGDARNGVFVYLDDVLFTGNRIGNDLSRWLTAESPQTATVHVVVIAAHRFGEFKCGERLQETAGEAGKRIRFRFWMARRIENRRSHRNVSEVLWPATLPDDAALMAYMAEEKRFPFEPRKPSERFEHRIFSSEDGRQLLERELLLAGMRIRAFSQNSNPALRPLGWSPFGLGFGSTIVTYRNCPNNVPLALWWGDPQAHLAHPFSRWYPLLQRRTYAN